MTVEIERKFVLAQRPAWLDGCRKEGIEQGYVVIAGEVEVRLRRKGERSVLTVKRGEGLAREEVEIGIRPEQFDELWPLTEGRRVSKLRHYIELDEARIAEVDVYRGALDGLVTAEVEFESEPASETFEPPPWIGREVTGDDRYSNAALALHGVPD